MTLRMPFDGRKPPLAVGIVAVLMTIFFAFISGNLAVRPSLERAVLTAQYDQANVISRYILNWSEQRAERLDRRLTELEVAVSSTSEAASDLERRSNDGNNQVSQSFENIKSILSMMRTQAAPVEMPQRSGGLFRLFSPARAQTALPPESHSVQRYACLISPTFSRDLVSF